MDIVRHRSIQTRSKKAISAWNLKSNAVDWFLSHFNFVSSLRARFKSSLHHFFVLLFCFFNGLSQMWKYLCMRNLNPEINAKFTGDSMEPSNISNSPTQMLKYIWKREVSHTQKKPEKESILLLCNYSCYAMQNKRLTSVFRHCHINMPISYNRYPQPFRPYSPVLHNHVIIWLEYIISILWNVLIQYCKRFEYAEEFCGMLA